MRIGDSRSRHDVYLVLICLLVTLLGCTTRNNTNSQPSAARPSTAHMQTPISNGLSVSSIDVKQYLGIPSDDCKPPTTDISSLPPSALHLNVDAGKVVNILDHRIWNTLCGAYGYALAYEDLRPFWELNRSVGIFQSARVWTVLSDGPGQGRVERYYKPLLASAQLPLNPATKQPVDMAAFNFGCQIYSEDEKGNSLYNFWHLDRVVDIALCGGMKPIINFNQMPDALAAGTKIRCFQSGLINLPKDFNKWRDLCYNIVKHCIEKYGAEEVRTWYFVIWNEPDLPSYFEQNADSLISYLKLYDYAADGVKRADPEVKVGGAELGCAEGKTTRWFKPFLDHCAKGQNYATGGIGSPLDVITWHRYCDAGKMVSFNKDVMELIQNYPKFKDLPKIQTEWGSDVKENINGVWVRKTNTDDQYTNYESAHVCKYIAGLLQEDIGYQSSFARMGSVTRSEYYRYNSIAFGNHFIPMPVLNAYILLAKLGDEQVELTGSTFSSNIFGFAGRTQNGVQVLLYNFDEQDIESKGGTVDVALMVKGVPATWSGIKRYQIDGQHSFAWGKYPVDEGISMDQLINMEKYSRLKIIEQDNALAIKDGQISFCLSMPPNSVTLVVLGGEASCSGSSPSTHITRVLQEEGIYYSAQALFDNGDYNNARIAFVKLADDSFKQASELGGSNPYSFWGQKALYKVRDIASKQGDAEAADKARVRLLATTLTDVERFVLLNEHMKYLDSIGNKQEIETVKEEISNVRSRLEYFANWTKWVGD